MGMKTIRAKELELTKKCETLATFAQVAEELNHRLRKIDEAFKEIDAVRAELAGELRGLETFGIKEFIDYKESLDWIANSSSRYLTDLSKKMTRPLPLDPLRKAVRQQQDEISQLMTAWMEKHTATFPKELKVGMCFKCKDGSVIEIVGVENHGAGYKAPQAGQGIR